MHFCRLLFFFYKFKFFKRIFQKYYQTENGFDPDQDRPSGSKLFAKVATSKERVIILIYFFRMFMKV